MLTLTPWSAGWPNLVLEDGTPIWEDEQYGNAAVVARLYTNAREIIDAVLPESTDESQAAYIESLVNGTFQHPMREAYGYDNPRQWNEALNTLLTQMAADEGGYVTPSAFQLAAWYRAVNVPAPLTGPADQRTPVAPVTTVTDKPGINPMLVLAVAVGGYLLLSKK